MSNIGLLIRISDDAIFQSHAHGVYDDTCGVFFVACASTLCRVLGYVT